MNPPICILVVDDEPDTRHHTVDLLTKAGYEVVSANDGAAGLDELQTWDFDLVITDNVMPRMTGIEMMAKLYACRLLPSVIMATGQVPTHEFTSKPWLTPNATLQRPFSDEDLLATVRRVLHAEER